MNILFLYETYSSGTETVSQIAGHFFQSKNHTVSIQKAHETDPLVFAQFDLIVLASPSWWVDEKDGQPHINYKQLFEKSESVDFSTSNFAIIGLGDSTYAKFCGAVDHLETFITNHKGSLVIDSLRIDSFYFDRENNERVLIDWLEKVIQNPQ